MTESGSGRPDDRDPLSCGGADAADIYTLGEWAYHGMAYAEVDHPHGEVQVFHDYGRRVSAARVARREILAELPELPGPDTLRPLVWDRGHQVRHRRRRC